MLGKIAVALAQLNPTVGDISGNLDKLRMARSRAAGMHADLLVTSELYLCGYPTEDLILKPSFQNRLKEAAEGLARDTADGGPAILLGVPWREKGKLYNAILLLDNGKIAGKTLKHDLPNYGPFDEKRVFASAPLPKPLCFRGINLGVMICEDMWTPNAAKNLKDSCAEILIVPNGSPFEIGKTGTRTKLARERVNETGLSLVYLNQVGGQDELVFDGASFVLDASGNQILKMPSWEEHLVLIQIDKNGISTKESSAASSKAPEEIYHALMTGLRDYVNKNGFPGVVLGLSGGIDSSLAAIIAADALGPERVWGVMLPSPYTSKESTEDAVALAQALGCKLSTIPITGAMNVFDQTLSPVLGDSLKGITQENIQARSRGLILMALSNATGSMVLSTGNKSELSVGYATLYGDMCGGFAVLKDVYKTEIYKVARWRNGHKPTMAMGPGGVIIPDRVFTKAPTAELRPNQKDQDSLPPYEVLDAILQRLIEKDMGIREIANEGYDVATVERVWAMLDRAEYKRRQAPPGVKITSRILGRDRRYPITNKYREGAE
ncbi:MAG: NAD+ synthase [Alphaproteobacteria bacterium]|nr:NAD+ synthase [Alphaproteobacteria bacterium]